MSTTKGKNHCGVVDRFEDGGWVVLEMEGGHTMDVPATWLPEGSREGDAVQVRVEQGGATSEVTFTLDPGETKAGKERVRSKLDALRGR